MMPTKRDRPRFHPIAATASESLLRYTCSLDDSFTFIPPDA
jgi:hypothetical protein